MNKRKIEIACQCDFCQALQKQVNKDQLYCECGFYFPFILNSLTWRDQVAIGQVRELYPMSVNGKGTIFFVEAGKENTITTASADKITSITGANWKYVTCKNNS